MLHKSLRINQKQAYYRTTPVSIKGLWFEVPSGGGAKAGSQQRFIKAMTNILSIRYDSLNLYVI